MTPLLVRLNQATRLDMPLALNHSEVVTIQRALELFITHVTAYPGNYGLSTTQAIEALRKDYSDR